MKKIGMSIAKSD